MGDVVGAVVGFSEKDGVEQFFDVLLWGWFWLPCWFVSNRYWGRILRFLCGGHWYLLACLSNGFCG